MYTFKQLNQKFGVPVSTLDRWYYKRPPLLKATQGVNKFNPNERYVSHEDWLEIPTNIRNRYHRPLINSKQI